MAYGITDLDEIVENTNPKCSLGFLCPNGRGCNTDPAFCGKAHEIKSRESFLDQGNKNRNYSLPPNYNSVANYSRETNYSVNTFAAGDYLSQDGDYSCVSGDRDYASTSKGLSYNLGESNSSAFIGDYENGLGESKYMDTGCGSCE